VRSSLNCYRHYKRRMEDWGAVNPRVSSRSMLWHLEAERMALRTEVDGRFVQMMARVAAQVVPM